MATITEDYVSFEVSKLFKEKGVNISIDSKNWICCMYDENGNIHWGIYDGNWYFRITHQMAMKWLREVHKLDIDVSIEYKNSKKVYYYSILKKTVIRNIDCLHSETNFDSYEQAAEAAIKYCLENLI